MAASQQLWSDYLFLTREMERFVGQDGDELFFDLLEQRERLQAQICATPDKWLSTPAGRELLAEVGRGNTRITQRLQAALSRMKYQQTVSQAYDGYGAGGPVGARLDYKK